MNSRKPDSDAAWPAEADSAYQSVAASLRSFNESSAPTISIVVAFSGGLDSHFLLVAARRWSLQHNARLRAVYIDHGLQPESVSWGEHCGRVCSALSIPFTITAVKVRRGQGESPEKAARDARYSALEQTLQQDEWLLTAHHADDQTETLMLQLLRGAGVQGLAAMPECKRFGAGLQIRPMLLLTRNTVEVAARSLQLQWIEDRSNADLRYDRNYLRHQVLPLLRSRWPAADRAFARTANHASQAARLLSELAAMDAPVANNVLDVALLNRLTNERRINALRAWISHHGYVSPSTVKLDHLVKDLVMAQMDSSGCIIFDVAEVRRHRQQLYIGDVGSFSSSAPFSHIWANRAEELYIPETGETLTGADLPLPWIPDNIPLQVTSRRGGEKLKLGNHQHHQSVKSLLQQQGLPPWQRCRLPFIWRDNELLGVVGLGFIAAPVS